MEWFYQSHSIKRSLQNLFFRRKYSTSTDFETFLVPTEEINLNVQKAPSEIYNNNDNNSNQPFEQKIWRRFSFRSFRKSKQKRNENKTKVVIPEVVRTYDNQSRKSNF